MFIVFEGVDAAGKTTVARLLARHLQAAYYATPPKRFLAEREQVDLCASAEEHYQYYLAGIKEASSEIWDLLADGKVVVGDRYWATTYVYHKVMGAAVSLSDFSGLVMPDVTALLTVSPEVQSYRFVRRGMSAGDRRMLNQQEALSREFKTLYASSAQNLVSVDTSHLTPTEVMLQVLAEIKDFA